MAGEPYELTGLAVPDGLEDLHALLERAARENPQVPAGDLMMLETAVMEVAGNVIEHGRPQGGVRWAFTVAVGAELRAQLRDDGHEYDGALDAVMPDVLAESGRGLSLAGLALDELRYDRQGAVNVWTMVRRIAQSR